MPEQFVSEHLQSGRAELLCTVNFSGVQGYIYVLLEHKSQADPLTSFQVLGSMLKLWDLHLKTEGLTQNGRLPFVLPLVLYHGEMGWKRGRCLSEVVECPAGLEAHVPVRR